MPVRSTESNDITYRNNLSSVKTTLIIQTYKQTYIVEQWFPWVFAVFGVHRFLVESHSSRHEEGEDQHTHAW